MPQEAQAPGGTSRKRQTTQEANAARGTRLKRNKPLIVWPASRPYALSQVVRAQPRLSPNPCRGGTSLRRHKPQEAQASDSLTNHPFRSGT
jgi:hypothetical protein